MHLDPLLNSPRLVIPSSEIVDYIRMPDTFRNLVGIPSIPFQRHNLAQITHHPQMTFLILIPVWHNNLSTGFTELGDGVST